jgi:hypothetical protein
MHEYDVALKVLLQSPARSTLSELTGMVIAKWLDVELPRVQNLRLDLLGETVDRELLHLELQSTNNSAMALRMAEYCLGVYRLLGRFPRQVLLYVGEAPLRMPTVLRGGGLDFSYEAVDLRNLDGEALLESEEVSDNVIAILAHLRDHQEAVRRIVGRIARLEPAARESAIEQLFILAGLRRLEEIVEREARKMPIYIDILENKVLGREFKKGLQEGRQEGRQEGELAILRRQIEKRFGSLPSWAEQRLAGTSTEQLEELATRVLDAASLEDLLGSLSA